MILMVSARTRDLHCLTILRVLQAIILSTSSTLIAAVSIRLSLTFDVHPDNVTIPIVCAVMDLGSLWCCRCVLLLSEEIFDLTLRL